MSARNLSLFQTAGEIPLPRARAGSFSSAGPCVHQHDAGTPG